MVECAKRRHTLQGCRIFTCAFRCQAVESFGAGGGGDYGAPCRRDLTPGPLGRSGCGRCWTACLARGLRRPECLRGQRLFILASRTRVAVTLILQSERTSPKSLRHSDSGERPLPQACDQRPPTLLLSSRVYQPARHYGRLRSAKCGARSMGAPAPLPTQATSGPASSRGLTSNSTRSGHHGGVRYSHQ
jgi:hypothetical protein